MRTFSEYLIKNANLEAVRQELGATEPPTASGWLRSGLYLGAGPPRDDVLWGKESLATPRSQQFGEIVFLYADPTANAFVYEHARDGQLLRKLVWFPMLDEDWTPGWLFAAGDPEPWEAVLFQNDRLERFLKLEQERYDDEGRSAAFQADAARIREQWASGRIEAGRTYPECDATVALLVEHHYGAQRSG